MTRPTAKALPFGALLVAATLPAAVVRADGAVTLDQYAPAAGAEDAFGVGRPRGIGRGRWMLGVHLDYANDPLVFENEAGDADSESFSVVEHQLVAHIAGSYAAIRGGTLFFVLPVDLIMAGDEGTSPSDVLAADGASVGDATAGLRLQLSGDDESTLAFAAELAAGIPVASTVNDAQQLAGERATTFRPRLLAEVSGGTFAVTANMGARIRKNSTFDNLHVADELTYAIGCSLALSETVSAHASVSGATGFREFMTREQSPLEALAGIKWHRASGMFVALAAGPGLQRGYGAPDVRGVVTLGLAPRPEVVHAAPAATPEGDRDGDGLLDSADGCPDEPEDVDRFEDQNGCPDPNNDSDGFLDVSDACPNEPGVEALRGCPDGDRDGDTVVDRLDNCPDEAGPPANHGCREEQQVAITDTRLEIIDKIYFETDRAVILPRSFPLLDNVARVIMAHPEISLVRVEGHTDSRGNDAHNLALSEARAQAVVAYLTAHGVASERVSARGFGETRPVVPNARTAAQHAQNRRVEFNLGVDHAGIVQGESDAPAEAVDR